MHKSAKERKIAAKRDKQVEIAKILFAQQIRKQPHSHLNNVLETMRQGILESEDSGSTTFGSLTVGTPSQPRNIDRDSDLSAESRGNAMDDMFSKGAFRQKTGIVKEHVQMKFYHSDEEHQTLDAVDHYLLDRYDIVLNETDEEQTLDSMLSQGPVPVEKKKNTGFKFT